jgi:hypothetical protein
MKLKLKLLFIINKIKNKLNSGKREYKQPEKGILNYINPFQGTKITIPVLCLISITYAFHVMFMITLVPALDAIISPTNIMIGILKDKIGNKLSLLLCLLFTLDAIFFFNLPYILSFLQMYQLDAIQLTGTLIGMTIGGTLLRFAQSIAWYKSLKKWIV